MVIQIHNKWSTNDRLNAILRAFKTIKDKLPYECTIKAENGIIYVVWAYVEICRNLRTKYLEIL